MAAVGRLHYDAQSVINWKHEMNVQYAKETGTQYSRFPSAEGDCPEDEQDVEYVPMAKSAGSGPKVKRVVLDTALGDKGDFFSYNHFVRTLCCTHILSLILSVVFISFHYSNFCRTGETRCQAEEKE